MINETDLFNANDGIVFTFCFRSEKHFRSQTDISIMSVGGDVSQTITKNNTSVYGQIHYTDLSSYYAPVPQ